jgi:uncharacterized protein
MNTPLSTEPLTDEQLDELQTVLETFQSEDSVRDISELDGFFTALISSPEILPFSVWYNALWGNPTVLPKWKDDKAFDQFVNLLVQHMGNLEMVITEHPEEFGPIFNEVLDEAEDLTQEGTPSLQEWCYGYRRLADSWPQMPEDQDELLSFIVLQSLGDQAYEEGEAPKIDLATAGEMITHAALQLHQYWAVQRTPGTPVRAQEKVGRNDPCPCGSGKKFKQCCGR